MLFHTLLCQKLVFGYNKYLELQRNRAVLTRRMYIQKTRETYVYSVDIRHMHLPGLN